MYAERDTFGPASLSILATRSSDRVSDVLDFIPHLYYQSRISARYFRFTDGLKLTSTEAIDNAKPFPGGAKMAKTQAVALMPSGGAWRRALCPRHQSSQARLPQAWVAQ